MNMRSRRAIRRTSQQRPPVATDPFLALFQAGDSWFDAGSVTIDGVSGKVASWVDRMDPSHLLSQGVSGNQCAAPVADVSFGGALTCTFTNGAYVSNRAAAQWSFLHSGTGAEWTIVFKRTGAGALILAGNGASSPRSVMFAINEDSGYQVQNATSLLVANPTSLGAAPLSTATYSTQVLGASTFEFLSKSTLTASGAHGATPSASASPSPFALGAYADNSTPFLGGIAACFIWKRVLSAPQRATRDAYIQTAYSIAP